MTNVVTVTKENNRLTVLGRELHRFLEISTEYSHWIKRMIDYGFEEMADYSLVKNDESENSDFDTRFITQKIDHQLTIDMAKEISMIQRNEKGKQARKYFIECEKKLKSNIPALPTNLKEAYLMLAKQEEEREKLALERDYAVETKAEIGNRREATAMNTASQLRKENNKLKEEIGFSRDFATVKRMQIHTGRKFSWSPLRRYSKDNELEMKNVPDINYGTVKAYNKEAWYAVYDIDLEEIFN